MGKIMTLPPPDGPFEPPSPQPPTPPPSWEAQPPAFQQPWPAQPAVPQPPWPAHPPYIQPKSPAVAVVASLLVPGLGSMLSGNGGIGTLILCLWIVAFLASFILIGIPFAIGFWIWGMIQAHADAVKWNARHGIIS